MSETRKRRWGDRRDARWVKEVTGLQTVMANLMPNRADCEVYLHDTFDATELCKVPLIRRTPSTPSTRPPCSTRFFVPCPHGEGAAPDEPLYLRPAHI